MKKRIYADYAATSPLCEPAMERIRSLLDTYGNPSEGHWAGRAARAAVEEAREKVAVAIHASPGEIFFTAGGTEANNWVLSWCVAMEISPIEHPSIRNHPRTMTGKMGVSHEGIIRAADTAVASAMLVNNEVGTIQPVQELQEHVELLFHTDAVQAVGHIPVDVKALGVDTLSMSGHKFGAPKGIGALYVSQRVNRDFIRPLLYGGGQEGGKRSGTENTIGIAAMGDSIQWSVEHLEEHTAHIVPLRDKLIDGILSIPGTTLTGHPTQRAPGIASFIFEDVEGTALVGLLDRDGIAVSAGSACSAGRLTPSRTLLAMGYSEREAMGALRVSLGWQNTEMEVEAIIKAVRQRVRELRGR